MTGSSVGILKILIAYARYTVPACINIWYPSWLQERNGEGKCLLLFYFMSVYDNTQLTKLCAKEHTFVMSHVNIYVIENESI